MSELSGCFALLLEFDSQDAYFTGVPEVEVEVNPNLLAQSSIVDAYCE